MHQYTLLSDTTNPENQDKAAVFRKNDAWIFVVADGAGGMGGGLQAAELAVEAVKSTPDNPNRVECLTAIDHMLYSHPDAGEAALVVAVIQAGVISGVGAGDVEAWLIQDEQMMFISEHQKPKPLLGSGKAVPVAFAPTPCQGTLLLASDGLTKYVSPAKIAAIVKSATDLATCTRNLVEAARYPSGRLPDDITVVLAQSKS